MNILLTSAGRRTSLTLAFLAAARPLGLKVLVADYDPLAPAAFLADGAFQVPKVLDPTYISCLLNLAREQGVGLIVPTIDTELLILANQVEAFKAEGISLVVSLPAFIDICRDKWVTFQTFRAEGIAVPESWLPGSQPSEPPEQIFIKPRDGSASQQAYGCQWDALDRVLSMVSNPIIQECLEGAEITIDALLDFHGRPLHYVPRERIRTLGGESIQGVTLDCPGVDAWVEGLLEVCARLGARGPLTIQAFLTKRGPVLTEINPRFGGGFPLAQAAGGDYPGWLLRLRMGEQVEPALGRYHRGLYMTRYYTEIFTDTLPWARPVAPAASVLVESGSGIAASTPPSSWRVLTSQDAEAWREALPTERCVMGSLDYIRTQERYLGQAARLFVAGSGNGRVVYPFFLRPIPPHPRFGGQECWDIASPEYTGPMLLGDEPDAEMRSIVERFPAMFDQYCRSNGIVAEFAHLNPWHHGASLLNPSGIETNREIVYVDLSLGEEAIWTESLSSDTRRQTRQARDAGVRVRPAQTVQDVLAFHHLHHQTMVRLSALARYYLAPEYFLDIFEAMGDRAIFMLSEYEGQVVAGGLYFQDATDVYWHLSAVDMDFSRVRPVNAYHYETIKVAARAGKRRLLCGGAHKTGDGVFRFKAGFSPLRVPFQVYKRVRDPEIYAALTAELEPKDLDPSGSKFFPAYRATAGW